MATDFGQILSTFKFTDNQDAVIQDIKPTGDTFFVVDKIEGNYVTGRGGISGSGYTWIAMKENGEWKIISKEQQNPNCLVIDKYNVPSSIYTSCYNQNGTERFKK